MGAGRTQNFNISFTGAPQSTYSYFLSLFFNPSFFRLPSFIFLLLPHRFPICLFLPSLFFNSSFLTFLLQQRPSNSTTVTRYYVRSVGKSRSSYNSNSNFNPKRHSRIPNMETRSPTFSTKRSCVRRIM